MIVDGGYPEIASGRHFCGFVFLFLSGHLDDEVEEPLTPPLSRKGRGNSNADNEVGCVVVLFAIQGVRDGETEIVIFGYW